MRWLRGLLTVLAFTLATITVPASSACACSCGLGTDAEQAEHAEVIFDGDVQSVDRGWLWNQGRDVRVRVAVLAVHQGELTNRVTVETAAEGPACGEDFEEGRRYRFLVVRDGERYVTSSCSGNKNLGVGEVVEYSWLFRWGVATLVGSTVLIAGGVALTVLRRRRRA